MTFTPEIVRIAGEVITSLTERRLTIATAESCTGGLIAGALTAISGSSAAVYGGFVTYSNTAKMKMLGVPGKTLAEWGAVSEQTARAMAEGARRETATDLAIAVTGVAGPTGGTPDKPVGLVFIAAASSQGTWHLQERFGQIDRDTIREKTVVSALRLVFDVLGSDQL